MRLLHAPLFALALSAMCACAIAQPAATTQTPALQSNPADNAWFAKVYDDVISAADFDRVARETFRNKFYHGTPPEAEVNKMLREVGEMMIDRKLLHREQVARKIAADEKWVVAEIENYERRYAGSPAWAQQREQVLPNLRAQLELKSRFDIQEKAIRAVSASDAEVRSYYEQNPGLFTEPEKNRVSLILLKVHPSSPGSVWDDANKSSEEIKAALNAGADFAETARRRSQDLSATNGGDLGYLHQGMLAPNIESELTKLAVGSIGGPVRTLEGYAVFRLEDRHPAKLRAFADVEGRARDLYLRKKSDETWLAFLISLRTKAAIEIGPAFQKIMQTSNEVLPTQPAAKN